MKKMIKPNVGTGQMDHAVCILETKPHTLSSVSACNFRSKYRAWHKEHATRTLTGRRPSRRSVAAGHRPVFGFWAPKTLDT